MKKIKRIILLLVVVAICICGYEVKLGYDKYTDANDKKDETLLAETEEQNEQTVMEKTDNIKIPKINTSEVAIWQN